jgi:hypothetical protein
MGRPTNDPLESSVREWLREREPQYQAQSGLQRPEAIEKPGATGVEYVDAMLDRARRWYLKAVKSLARVRKRLGRVIG